VPSSITILPALPRLASGKVDRRALPAPKASTGDEEPRTHVERALADIWAQVLELDRVGIHDDFFGLGGHSLLAAQVVARIRTSLGLPVPLHAIFATPTIASLAESVAAEPGGQEVEALLAELAGMSDEEAERLLASLDG
jgi:hypothetical protein